MPAQVAATLRTSLVIHYSFEKGQKSVPFHIPKETTEGESEILFRPIELLDAAPEIAVDAVIDVL